jgi:GNAT superfamily N-acetyltransferase
LNRADFDDVEDFFLRLDRDSRCRRFGHAASDDVLRTHVAGAFNNASYLIGIFAQGELRGVLELYSCAPVPCAEAALVVEQGWRRRGFGWSLLRAAMEWAEGARESSLRLIFTRDNWPMRHLTSKANARVDLVLDEISAEIAPAARRRSLYVKSPKGAKHGRRSKLTVCDTAPGRCKEP